MKQLYQDRLTDQNYWDSRLCKSKVHGILTPYELIRMRPSEHRLASLFKPYLKTGHKRVLEIGCALGRWLVYLSRQFGSRVYGIDYNENGCKLAEEIEEREYSR